MRAWVSLLFWFFICYSIAWASPEIHINIPSYQLQLIENDKTIKEYQVAVGTPYEQTPVGSFRIVYKEENPTWIPGNNFTDHTPIPPGPDNPLGTRWLEFKTGYGIHGTNKGWDISYPVSGGCIRMQDADVREIYELVDIGTPVLITYDTMLMIEKADGLYLRLLPDIYDRNTNTVENLLQLYQPYSNKYPDFKLPQSIAFPAKTTIEVKIALPVKPLSDSVQPPGK